jgi:hypothetical protein
MKTIYVSLIDEGTDVWRPVRAKQFGPDIFQIPLETEIPEEEFWEFQPGEMVKCKEAKLMEGVNSIKGLVAYAKV